MHDRADGPVYVTKSFLPPIKEYEKYLEKIWDTKQLTNQGPLLLEFEDRAKKYLEVDDFHLVSNGTSAIQIALKALGIEEGEIITSPFSYVATTSAILWERCTPVYVDIDPRTLCIDPEKIEAAITKDTKAILAVHVFGNPCDVEKIQEIAKKHHLKVVYDAAHAFGVQYKGRSLLSYGDIAVCSFHATKPFHTIEGGCVISKDPSVSHKVDLIKRFGHNGDEHYMLGINAKASEFQAAMGLCNLEHIDNIIEARKVKASLYDAFIKPALRHQVIQDDTDYNYAYYPVLFKNEDQLNRVTEKLKVQGIYPRRYFHPSLNTLPYLSGDTAECPNSEDVSKRILCLPLYDSIEEKVIKSICEVVNREASKDS